ncbi:hypothetical protein HYU13_04685 [Candidatus Woesearchaeota archaeon]|nr:hypothetical protein [Candidatus Woesearchaeota archaeon]
METAPESISFPYSARLLYALLENDPNDHYRILVFPREDPQEASKLESELESIPPGDPRRIAMLVEFHQKKLWPVIQYLQDVKHPIHYIYTYAGFGEAIVAGRCLSGFAENNLAHFIVLSSEVPPDLNVRKSRLTDDETLKRLRDYFLKNNRRMAGSKPAPDER